MFFWFRYFFWIIIWLEVRRTHTPVAATINNAIILYPRRWISTKKRFHIIEKGKFRPLDTQQPSTPPISMCQRYIHLTICRHLDCGVQVGKKHRNVYCSAARRARRLGRCDDGLKVAAEISHRGTVSCTACKASRSSYSSPSLVKTSSSFLLTNEEEDVEDEQNDEFSSPRPAFQRPSRRRGRKPRNSVFRDVFEIPLEQQVKDFDKQGKRRRSGNNVLDTEMESEFSWLQVEGPEQKRRGTRQYSHEKKKPRANDSGSLGCYGL
ncbi:hypothetical protein PFICI_07831 [Pestalotiopsis fici W106-1]|uniref:Uncharacterized protein n=1 Tax=Pestalotiopsis fici (strain W106-1 / CGMCC3.15140) TaxID=1229662 RepID=W3X4J9_PESFW|nr:uncharacterized protein PFICI_07831 [Pestalotiopsis fici W106-1]ETS80302.1 hypothetical protein PFICI_07831 [Pestalotiopsis fici W106-1]